MANSVANSLGRGRAIAAARHGLSARPGWQSVGAPATVGRPPLERRGETSTHLIASVGAPNYRPSWPNKARSSASRPGNARSPTLGHGPTKALRRHRQPAFQFSGLPIRSA